MSQACNFWAYYCYKIGDEWKRNSLNRKGKSSDILRYTFRIAIQYKFLVCCDISIYCDTPSSKWKFQLIFTTTHWTNIEDFFFLLVITVRWLLMFHGIYSINTWQQFPVYQRTRHPPSIFHLWWDGDTSAIAERPEYEMPAVHTAPVIPILNLYLINNKIFHL